jgi:class 3 adenylate cyclase
MVADHRPVLKVAAGVFAGDARIMRTGTKTVGSRCHGNSGQCRASPARLAAPSMSEGEVPAQTRGFLFSDLRGYSAFVERHGDRAARVLLTRYRRIVRDVIGRFGGAEIRTEGDSFYVVFASVAQAVQAALAIQAALAADREGHPLRAGIGIHAGEVEDDAEHGIVSGAVNIAARMCAVAEPGQVLVSEVVRGLTRGYLDARFVPQGRRKLKGIDDAMAAYSVHRGTVPTRTRDRPLWRAVAVAGGALLVTALAVLASGNRASQGAGSVPGSAGDSVASPVPATMVGSARDASNDDVLPSFPNAAEASLLDLFPDEYRHSCEPASPGSLPSYAGPGPRGANQAPTTVNREPAFASGIICSPFSMDDPDEVAAWVVSDIWIDGGAEELIVNRAGVLGAPAGTCGETRRALEQWSAGPLGGKLLCFSAETAGSTLYWTYGGTDVFAKASRADGDLDALLQWWNDEARYRRP